MDWQRLSPLANGAKKKSRNKWIQVGTVEPIKSHYLILFFQRKKKQSNLLKSKEIPGNGAGKTNAEFTSQ